MPISDAIGYKNNILCFVEKKLSEPTAKLHVMEVGNPAPNQQKFKKTVDLQYAPEAPQDFPVLMHTVEKYGILFIITKMGFLFVYEIGSANLLLRQRITDNLIFVKCKNTKTDGMICVNKSGKIYAINADE